jgi:hypothetical protein
MSQERGFFPQEKSGHESETGEENECLGRNGSAIRCVYSSSTLRVPHMRWPPSLIYFH